MKLSAKALATIAEQAKRGAHAPYSRFRVGVALLAKDGRVITGCNIETSSYGLTMCAERTAVFKAISEGIRDFEAIAIASDDPGFTPPCGACRQVMLELVGDIDFIMVDSRHRLQRTTVGKLLPFAFTDDNLVRFRKKGKR